ncbi:MAG: hypothetical protein ABGZ53_23400, partial [Fuerstiella sp.]
PNPTIPTRIVFIFNPVVPFSWLTGHDCSREGREPFSADDELSLNIVDPKKTPDPLIPASCCHPCHGCGMN